MRCAHLLIKHAGSRNPVSRRTGLGVTMSKEDALKELQEFQSKINAENFTQLALERSDCGSYQAG